MLIRGLGHQVDKGLVLYFLVLSIRCLIQCPHFAYLLSRCCLVYLGECLLCDSPIKYIYFVIAQCFVVTHCLQGACSVANKWVCLPASLSFRLTH